MAKNYEFISKYDMKVNSAYSELRTIISYVRRNVGFQFRDEMVGSYSRDLITYEKKSNVGFDFDVNLIISDRVFEEYSPKQIKLSFKNAIDSIAPNYRYDFAEDSTSVLTIKVKDRQNSKILYSVDFAIIHHYIDEDGNRWQEYIRRNGKHYVWADRGAGFVDFENRFNWIERNRLRDELKEMYLRRKNNNKDKNKHSRSLLAESVNNICNEYGYFD